MLDTRHVATPSSVTYVKDSKETKTPKKILESPRSACGGRGAISSRSAERGPDGLGLPDSQESGHGDNLASLMRTDEEQTLVREVEGSSVFSLVPSRTDRRKLAAGLSALLETLPQDLVPDDITNAIRSDEFDGLDSRSWGLLLQKQFVVRFAVEIRKKYGERTALWQQSLDSIQRCRDILRDGGVADRISAIESLVNYMADESVPQLLASCLVGDSRDPDSSVRFSAAQKLEVRVERIPATTRQMLLDELPLQGNESEFDEVRHLLTALRHS